jgi:hypothetical protein
MRYKQQRRGKNIQNRFHLTNTVEYTADLVLRCGICKNWWQIAKACPNTYHPDMVQYSSLCQDFKYVLCTKVNVLQFESPTT